MDLREEQVSKAVQALKMYAAKREKAELLNKSVAIQLQLGFKKVPRMQNKIIKISLPKPLVSSTTDICLFVKDLDKGSRDYSATVTHFKDLLQEHKVKCISEVIPLKSLKTEYQPYEAKKNLSNMFDVFLSDERIVRLLPPQLGKNFYKRKKYPIQVNMKATDLKKEIKRALALTQCIISGRGSTCQVTVSNTSQKEEHAVKNVIEAANKLAETIPGGVENIKTLNLKTTNSPALPIYMSLESPNDIEVPTQKRKYELDEPEEVTTVMHGKVRVTPFGAVQVITENTKDNYNTKGYMKPSARKEIKRKQKERQKMKKKSSKVNAKEEDTAEVPEKENDTDKDVKSRQTVDDESDENVESSNSDDGDDFDDDDNDDDEDVRGRKVESSTKKGKQVKDTMKKSKGQAKAKSIKKKTGGSKQTSKKTILEESKEPVTKRRKKDQEGKGKLSPQTKGNKVVSSKKKMEKRTGKSGFSASKVKRKKTMKRS